MGCTFGIGTAGVRAFELTAKGTCDTRPRSGERLISYHQSIKGDQRGRLNPVTRVSTELKAVEHQVCDPPERVPGSARQMTFSAGDIALPTDPAIPALAAISESGWEVFLAGVRMPGRFQGWELVHHQVGDRYLFRIHVAGKSFAVKATRADAAGTVDLAAALAIHGFASGRPPTIPPVVAHSLQLNVVVSVWLDGRSGADLVANNQGQRAGALAAQWLWAIHDAPIALGPRYNTSDVLRDVTRWAGLVAGQDSGLGVPAQRLQEVLAQAPPSRPLHLAHGSLVPRHVLDLGNGPGVIDWESFRQAAIEFDAATFLAYLQRMSLRPRLAPGTHEAATAFRSELDGLVDPHALAWYEAVNRLRFAAYLVRKRREHWQIRANALLGPSLGRQT